MKIWDSVYICHQFPICKKENAPILKNPEKLFHFGGRGAPNNKSFTDGSYPSPLNLRKTQNRVSLTSKYL